MLRVARELRKETGQFGVTSRQATLLAVVKASPGLTLRGLAEAEAISAPALSEQIDRLERAGLLRRLRSEVDRRRVGLELTPEGERLLRSIRERRTAWLAERLSALDPEDLRAIEAAIGPLRKLWRATPLSSVTFALRTRTFRSLRRHYNYRLFFAGQIVSLAGSWMQNVALAWLVLSLSHSPIAVALLLFCRFVPYTLFGLFAGSVVDRFETRLLVIWTQAAAMLVSAALAFVSLTGTATLPVVYILATIGGIAVVLDAPGRQSLTFEMVGPRELPNAVALNSGLVNASRIVGPALAGILIAVAGVGLCFVVNTISFLAVLAALLLMRTDELFPVAADRTVTLLKGTREGLAFAWHDRQVRVVLVVMTCVGLVGFNFNTLVPLLASDTLHVDARAFGLLSAAFGLGAFAGAIIDRVAQAGHLPGVHPRHVRLQHPSARPRPGPRGPARGGDSRRHRRIVHALCRQRECARAARRARPSPGTARRALPLLVRRSCAPRIAPLRSTRRGRRDRARLHRQRQRRPRGDNIRDRRRPIGRRPSNEGAPPDGDRPISGVPADATGGSG